MESQQQKRKGRPPKPVGERRTARLQMRTFPDIAEKVARVGTDAVEAAIRKIKEPNS
jgi:flagellar motor switch protein FliM